MSLTVALNAAQVGLQLAEKKIAVVAGNISNADRPGYTRKTLVNDYVTTGLVTLPVSGRAVQAVTDDLLVRQVNTQSTVSAAQQKLSEYLSSYAQSLGSTSKDASTLSSTIDSLNATFQILEANPSDNSAKTKVISTAQSVAAQLNAMSQSVQNERLRANEEIAQSVVTINTSLQNIALLNKEISSASASGYSVADLVDQRNQSLLALTQEIGVQYFTNDQNQVYIYNHNGQSLLSGANVAQFGYDPVGSMTSSSVYPGGIPAVILNGADVTTLVGSGKLASLITLRDSTFTDEQAKLDVVANQLQSTVNTALNRGTSYPPLNTVTGSNVVSGATALSATGTLRIALTDTGGVLQTYTDFNLSSYATVGALVTAIDGILGLSATIDTDGHLVIDAVAANHGVSVNTLDSNMGGGVGASQYFGLNNLFVTNGVGTAGASNIAVNSNLIGNNAGLATGVLSNAATLTASSRVVTSGDASVITSVIDAFNATISFGAAGNFGARTATLASYAAAIISDVATRASAAKISAEAAQATYTYLSDTLSNATGVNIDEETANLTALQTNYQANAHMISTLKTLFESLLNAFR